MIAVPADNKEKLLLYLSVSVSAGLLSLLALVIGRLLWQRRKQQVAAASTTLPSFADDLSEVDTDIDLTAPATITVLANSLSPGEVSYRDLLQTFVGSSLCKGGQSNYKTLV